MIQRERQVVFPVTDAAVKERVLDEFHIESTVGNTVTVPLSSEDWAIDYARDMAKSWNGVVQERTITTTDWEVV